MTSRYVVILVPNGLLDAPTYASVERLITDIVHVIHAILTVLSVDGGDMS